MFRPPPPESLLAADMARVLVVVLVAVVDGDEASVDRCGSDCHREEGGRKAALFATGRGAAAAAVEEVANTRGR